MDKSDIQAKARSARFIPDRKWTEELTVSGQLLWSRITQPHVFGRLVYCAIFLILFVIAIVL